MIGERFHISTIYNYSISMFLCLFTALFSLNTVAQETDNEVKRLHRPIFVFNFAQQIGWPNIEEQKSFKIGVLGPDLAILDLHTMAQKRKIHGKPVEIVRFTVVKDVKDIQLLYVNHKYNYDIKYILSKISGKNILLVSEDYNYNASMINMVNVAGTFEYEINESRIEKENFVIVPTLKEYAITSSEKWKRLYRKTEKTLTKVQEDKDKQEVVFKDRIADKEKEIETKEGEIIRRNEKIENLYTESEIQKIRYKEKISIERELEKNIQEQILFIKNQEEKIKASTLEIEKQNEFLEQQNSKIEKQSTILKRQTSEINAQKKINILLVGIIFLALVGSLLIYKGFLQKKKLNKELGLKNEAISQQSLELEVKNKELEQFAYIASHDLQEPLNTISSFIGLIAEDYGASFDDLGKESLSFIEDASDRMKKLIDALLEYSRLGRSKAYAEVDCNQVLKELKSDLKSRIENTGAILDITDLPMVNGSEIELRLLFQNLISNGIKFRTSDTIPEITINCVKKRDDKKDTKSFWEFSVKDNGIGIPEEHQERIFAIFQRLHSRDAYEGTGIGLAHCKKIVEAHGGKIWLESFKNQGSTFYFTIPV